MLSKLAFRNVKRQIGDYLVYFITVSLTVALMFAVNNAILSGELLARAEAYEEMKQGLIALTVFVSLIVAFVLGYATSYILKLRKREFGVYLTLGMTRRNIVTIFLTETLLMCLAALAVGLILGFVLFQGLTLLLSNMMDIEFAFSAFSVQGLLLTVGLVVGMFLLSSLTSTLYLYRVRVNDLVHADKKVEKGKGSPLLWLIAAFCMLTLTIASLVLFYFELKGCIFGGGGINKVLIYAVLFVTGMVLLHFAFAKSATYLMMKSKRFRSKGTNTFTLRQLSARLGSTALLCGMIAFLLTFAVAGSNVSFLLRAADKATLDNDTPYDVLGLINTDEEPGVGFEAAHAAIADVASIEKRYDYASYTTDDAYLCGFTPWQGASYEGMTDTYMKLSDFNALMRGLGKQELTLGEDEYAIVCRFVNTEIDFGAARPLLGGREYRYAGRVEAPVLLRQFFYAVVPDRTVAEMRAKTIGAAFDLGESKFDASALQEALSYELLMPEGYKTSLCDYSIRAYSKMQRDAQSAVYTLAVMYLAVIFLFMAMAILALKTLSTCDDDRMRYAVLSRLGADARLCRRTLLRQTGAFFFLPFVLPILVTIPAGIICSKMAVWSGYPSLVGTVAVNCVAIALVLAAVYLLYFGATYLLAKRKILRVNGQARE